MKPEEAIRILYQNAKGFEVKDATMTAIEALEKQIPKKLRLTIGNTVRCSNCKK